MHLEVKHDLPAVLRPLTAFPSREDDEFPSLQPISLRGELCFVPANPFIVIFQPGYHIWSHLATSLLPQRGRRSKFHFQLTGNSSSAVPGVGQLWKKGPTFCSTPTWFLPPVWDSGIPAAPSGLSTLQEMFLGSPAGRAALP